jgi:hypothetical protein
MPVDFQTAPAVRLDGRMTRGIQATAGIVVAAIGIAGIVAMYRPIAEFAYPIVWWGLLVTVDALCARKWGTSPMRADAGRFLGITVPLSVLFWLVYEYLNLFFPQWRYRGELEGTATQVAFGFVSFATVIPIMIEFQWLVAGPSASWNLPRTLVAHARAWRAAYAAAGIAMLVLPVWSGFFWLNQAAWIGPAIALLPFVVPAAEGAAIGSRRFFVSGIAAALIGGFFWELINYWALTKWEYTIHPEWPRLFEMPLLGYLGFVPFAFSALAVYAAQKRWRAHPALSACLWAAATGAMYGLVTLYRDSEFWAPAATSALR